VPGALRLCYCYGYNTLILCQSQSVLQYTFWRNRRSYYEFQFHSQNRRVQQKDASYDPYCPRKEARTKRHHVYNSNNGQYCAPLHFTPYYIFIIQFCLYPYQRTNRENETMRTQIFTKQKLFATDNMVYICGNPNPPHLFFVCPA
jgi:hypothetical protein